MDKLLIKKADGTTEVFKEEKLRNSLKRSGATDKQIEEVVSHVTAEIHTDVTSDEVFKHAFEVLNKIGGSVAAKYSLRRAISQLGPSGFPFEQFMSRVFNELGYRSHSGVIVNGKCAEHEIDVVAENDQEVIFMELKFHNNFGLKSDMKVALYVQARHNDLKKNNFGHYADAGKKSEFWLVTNTKFTSNSIKYAKCAGLKMIGWSYPSKGNLQEIIESSGLQPITCLTTLTTDEKSYFLNKNIVLCKTLQEKEHLLIEAGLDKNRVENTLTEIKGLSDLG
ncbi:ATPase [Candidatus Campbellbacteria bacterium CG22_combo_CG10-13_8_21_14_all_36_13]|uniref:ATPase n=1 Tax=Candidatus Campbellbacteria bacterium CG22_combo_CG10-13_8_21_14_all_36_13 TaxID=1974529 RepID=A0A2H0DYJ7_9BACT|nr:MAG: ATPase [Candidatus Campbellbacteria bacterium CG22_combo_CG10-13_8_21_14_all_36_13]